MTNDRLENIQRRVCWLLAVLAVAVAACVPNLNVPAEAQISCATDDECPTDHRCLGGQCVALIQNTAPAVSIGLIERSDASVTVPLVVFDPESDPVTLAARFRIGTESNWIATDLSQTEVASSPEGKAVSLQWQARVLIEAQGYVGYTSGIALEIVPRDTDSGQAVVSEDFDFGNSAPEVVAVRIDDAIVSGKTVVHFQVADSSEDRVHVTLFEVSRSGGFLDVPETDVATVVVPSSNELTADFPGGTLVDLGTTEEGRWHNVTWQSDLSAAYDAETVRIHIAVTDTWGAVSDPPTRSGPFAVDNDSLPPVLTVTPVTDLTAEVYGDVEVTLVASDADGDLFSVSAEYSLNDGAGFTPCFSTSQTTLLTPDEPHSFIWDVSQLAPARYDVVTLQFVADDGLADDPVVLDPFVLDTREDHAPIAIIDSLTRPDGGRFLNTAEITFTLTDADDDRVALELRYTTDGSNWHEPTQADDAPITIQDLAAPSSGGAQYTFIWDVLTDAEDGKGLIDRAVIIDPHDEGTTMQVVDAISGVIFRITPTDATGEAGTPRSSSAFSLGNEAPEAWLESFANNEVSQLVPLDFFVADSTQDSADIEVRFRVNDVAIDPSGLWRTADLAHGTFENLTTSEGGSSYLVLWNSAHPLETDPATPQGLGLLTSADVELQVRGVDYPQPSLVHYGSWSPSINGFQIINQTPPRIEPVYAKTDGDLRNGIVPIVYRLIDEESDRSDVKVEFSLDDGLRWSRCTEYADAHSEGTVDLFTAPGDTGGGGGIMHTFMWESSADLLAPDLSVEVRMTAADYPSGPGSPILVASATAMGSPLFDTPLIPVSFVNIGGNGQRVAVDDLDGDGFSDVVTLSRDTDVVDVLLGLGDGGFAAPLARSVTDAERFELGYFNSDSVLDLAISSSENGGPFELGKLVVLHGVGDGTFVDGPGSPYPTPGDAQALVSGNFNADGFVDIAVVTGMATIAPVRIFVGQADGTFVNTGAFDASMTHSMAVGDFDSDGNLDIIGAGSNDYLSLLLGNGDATFAAAIDIPLAGENASTVAVADLNADGHLDAVTHYPGITSHIAVLLGTGTGDFDITNIQIDGDSYAIALGDLNADRIHDIVTTDVNSQAFTILAGQGNGWFGAPRRLACGQRQGGVAIADFNGDLNFDLVMGNWGAPSNVGIHLMDNQFAQTAHFSYRGSLPTGRDPIPITSADFDSDGIQDLVVADDFGLTTWTGQQRNLVATGAMSQQARLEWDLNTTAVARGDFNADKILDLAVANDANGPKYVTVLLGESDAGVGTGQFAVDADYPVNGWTQEILSCDLNNDGALDLLSIATIGATEELAIFLGQLDGGVPNGTFAPAAGSPMALSNEPYDLVCHDFNGDWFLDVAIAFRSGRVVEILLGDGTGILAPTPESPMSVLGGSYNVLSLAAGDYDTNGITDLAVGTSAGVKVLIGDGVDGLGDGTFTEVAGLPAAFPDDFDDLLPGDVNGDGILDLIGITRQPGVLTILVGNGALGVGDGTFSVGWSAPGGSWPQKATTTDLNQDGMPDVVLASTAAEEILTFTGRRAAHNYLWNRLITPWRSGHGNALGTGTLDDFIDAFGDKALFRLGLRRFHGPHELSGEVARHGDSVMGANFQEMVRHAGIPGTSALVPLTHAWLTTGDKRLTREVDPALGGAPSTGLRWKVSTPFGSRTESTEAGLDLTSSSLAEQRGVVVDLPIIRARDNDTIAPLIPPYPEIVVVACFLDWVRASETCYDPMGPSAGDCGGTAALGAHGYLPRIPAPGPEAYRDVVQPTLEWNLIQQDANDDLAAGDQAGPRFVVELDDRGNRRIRVLTDRFGVFQAFLKMP